MNQRSSSQNRALHKLLEDVAREMLNQGIERKTVINDLEGYECPIDASFLKEVFKTIMFTMTTKTSTATLTTKEMQDCYEVFSRFLSEQYAIHLPWPSMESMTLAWYDSQVS